MTDLARLEAAAKAATQLPYDQWEVWPEDVLAMIEELRRLRSALRRLVDEVEGDLVLDPYHGPSEEALEQARAALTPEAPPTYTVIERLDRPGNRAVLTPEAK
jgi:hypothetical protein